jgi:hypothetical protein
MVHSAQTVHLSCIKINTTPNGMKQASTWPMSPRSTIGHAWKDFHAHGTFGANCTPFLRLDEHHLQIDRNVLPHDTHHLQVPSGVPKMMSMPVVHSTQTVHPSSAEINTISKWTETSFHLTHVTLEYHRVCQKWFPSLWYIRCKPCTYLVSRLALSPNREKQASTWHTLSRSTRGCAQSDCCARGRFVANRTPILRRE